MGCHWRLNWQSARIKLLSAKEIASRLDDRFELLTGGSRTALPRQQTLRATLDWSYELLTESRAKIIPLPFGVRRLFQSGSS